MSRMVGLVLACCSVAPQLQAQHPSRTPRPPEVTDSAVARGREVFHGAGACSSCHGVAGVGTDSGPALAEGVWLHGPDSYAAIRARVVHGIPRAYSTRGLAMPMRGWNSLSDREVDDVAAYVWVLSHSWPRGPIRAQPPS